METYAYYGVLGTIVVGWVFLEVLRVALGDGVSGFATHFLWRLHAALWVAAVAIAVNMLFEAIVWM